MRLTVLAARKKKKKKKKTAGISRQAAAGLFLLPAAGDYIALVSGPVVKV